VTSFFLQLAEVSKGAVLAVLFGLTKNVRGQGRFSFLPTSFAKKQTNPPNPKKHNNTPPPPPPLGDSLNFLDTFPRFLLRSAYRECQLTTGSKTAHDGSRL